MISTESTQYRVLTWIAMGIALLVVLSLAYTYIYQGEGGNELNYRRGNLRLEEGKFAKALENFDAQLRMAPDHLPARLSRALALMGLGRMDESLDDFNMVLEERPDFAAAFANRGILNDRMGNHEQARQDYLQAIELDPSLAEGPGWLTRFFRSQWDSPPTIADRARYIGEQLQLPARERVMRMPELDAEQRSYKIGGKL